MTAPADTAAPSAPSVAMRPVARWPGFPATAPIVSIVSVVFVVYVRTAGRDGLGGPGGRNIPGCTVDAPLTSCQQAAGVAHPEVP